MQVSCPVSRQHLVPPPTASLGRERTGTPHRTGSERTYLPGRGGIMEVCDYWDNWQKCQERGHLNTDTTPHTGNLKNYIIKTIINRTNIHN